MHEVVLCADEETVRDPSLIGLEGESFETQRWLHPISGAEEARDYLRAGGGADEIWVASSNEVDPINLAAALKRDCADKTVCLLAWRGSGSLMSRASAAGIDEVLGYREMASRYARLKRQHRQENPRRRVPARAAGQSQAPLARGGFTAGADEGGEVPASRPPSRPPQEAAFRPEVLEMPVRRLEGRAPLETQPMPRVEAGPQAPRMRAPSPAMPPVRKGYALTVVSASGGTGKSTVAALAALLCAHHGYRTVLVDADLQFGDAQLMLGDTAGLPIDKVVADPQRLDTATPAEGRPVVVSAPERMEQSELYLPQVPGVIDRARETYDVVVVNTGSFWTETHLQMMECSSNTLFLMDQRPTSVQAARRALELCSRCGVAAHPFLFAVNRCTRNSLLSSVDISCALNGASVAELKDGGRAVAELAGSGRAWQLVEDRNDLCLSLNELLGQVVPAALGGAEAEASMDARGRGRAKRGPFRKKRRAA